jgi:hypothetical protein
MDKRVLEAPGDQKGGKNERRENKRSQRKERT